MPINIHGLIASTKFEEMIILNLSLWETEWVFSFLYFTSVMKAEQQYA